MCFNILFYSDLSISYKSSFIILKNIDLIGRKKANQIQDNGEKKPGILDLNIIEQPKQFVLPEVVSEYIDFSLSENIYFKIILIHPF